MVLGLKLKVTKMAKELITTDTILEFLQECFENKKTVSPHVLIDSAYKLNILVGNDHDKLYDLQQKVALAKVLHIENNKSVAEAKVRVEGSDIFKEMRVQEAKIGRIEEAVRISKLMARMKNDEIKGY